MASLIIYKANVWCAIVFSMILTKLATAYIQRNSYNVEKRMDIETCEGRFNIQREMIIKTEESRKLGAKYLDYADVGSREECLRLCCETVDCDVFVFEEKAIGSCFLFHCGPAQNFRCKFVEHANYTSAVLTTPIKKVQQAPAQLPGMYSMQLPTPASLSQHEIELSNLKGGKSTRGDGTAPVKGAPSAYTSTTRVSSEVINNNHSDKATALCGRYQFACHSGECIAIYNACDGIPQCFDGSDEGPGCPTTVSPLVKNTALKQKDGRVTLHKSNMAVQSTMQKQLQNDRFYNGATHNREDPMTAPQWIPPMSVQQMDNNQQGYVDSSSHIFNHKGGIQISNNNNQQQIYAPKPGHNMDMVNGYADAAPRESYMPIQNYQLPQWGPEQGMNGNWPQQLPQFPNKPVVVAPHPDGQMDHSQGQMMVDPQVEQEMLSPNWPVRPILPVNVPIQVDSNTLTQNNVKQTDEKPKTVENSNNDEHKTKANDQDYSESAENKETDYENEEKPTEKPKKKSRKHKKIENNSKKLKETNKKPDNDDDNSFQSDVSIEFIDHDGLAERPGGAVLSLTLGVIVMAALAIVVGCRANVARRRGRRGGKNTYAHDADFLVNGMYL